MAELAGNLWDFNFAKLVVIDVTDDYRLMQPPLPSACYPVLAEIWVPRHGLLHALPDSTLVEGYLYDWHESPEGDSGSWYVGVVHHELLREAGLLGPS
jgi:hypothetical protein